MNAAHLHITLVHLPIVLVPTATVLLLIALWRKQAVLTTTALSIFIVATLTCVPAFLIGEDAEELVEHLAGVSEDTIEEHEEAADVAFWLTIAAGSGALLAFVIRRAAPSLRPTALKVLTVLGAVASGALTYTAYEGGKIRHPEAYQGNAGESDTHESHKDHND